MVSFQLSVYRCNLSRKCQRNCFLGVVSIMRKNAVGMLIHFIFEATLLRDPQKWQVATTSSRVGWCFYQADKLGGNFCCIHCLTETFPTRTSTRHLNKDIYYTSIRQHLQESNHNPTRCPSLHRHRIDQSRYCVLS